MRSVERFCHSPKFAGVASDVISIRLGGTARMLLLSGVAAEQPDGAWLQADLAHGANINCQLRFVWARITQLLQLHGATPADIVKLVIYATDARYLIEPIATFLQEQFKGGAVPAATGVVVTALAWPGMLIEIDVTAVVEG